MIKTISVIALNSDNKILALKRSHNKKWYANKWDIISGTFEENETPEQCLKREIFEETNSQKFEIIESKESYIYEKDDKKWLVHPYKILINEEIIINHEHSEFKWVELKELLTLDFAEPLETELKHFYDI